MPHHLPEVSMSGVTIRASLVVVRLPAHAGDSLPQPCFCFLGGLALVGDKSPTALAGS
jgi:hypothetical protein